MNAFISPLEALFILLILTTARSEIMNLAHKPFPWNPANIQQMPTWLVQMITITVKILILNNSHYIHKHTVYTKTPEIIIMGIFTEAWHISCSKSSKQQFQRKFELHL